MRPKLTPRVVPKHPILTELPACEDRVIASTVGTAVLELARLLTGVATVEAITLPLQLLPRACESAISWLSPSPATKIAASTPTSYTPRPNGPFPGSWFCWKNWLGWGPFILLRCVAMRGVVQSAQRCGSTLSHGESSSSVSLSLRKLSSYLSHWCPFQAISLVTLP